MRKKQLQLNYEFAVREHNELQRKLNQANDDYAELLEEFNHVLHHSTILVQKLSNERGENEKLEKRIAELERLIETELADMIHTYDMKATVLDNKPVQKEKLF